MGSKWGTQTSALTAPLFSETRTGHSGVLFSRALLPTGPVGRSSPHPPRSPARQEFLGQLARLPFPPEEWLWLPSCISAGPTPCLCLSGCGPASWEQSAGQAAANGLPINQHLFMRTFKPLLTSCKYGTRWWPGHEGRGSWGHHIPEAWLASLEELPPLGAATAGGGPSADPPRTAPQPGVSLLKGALQIP